MAVTCEESPNKRQDLGSARLLKIAAVFGYMMTVVLIIATVYFYIIKRKRQKPRFITAIFVLLNLLWPLAVVVLIIDFRSLALDTPLYRFTYSIRIAIPILQAVIHWVFAISYFEVAISTYLFIKYDELSE